MFIDGKHFAKKFIKGVWLNISQIDLELEVKGISISELFKKVVGNGDKYFFWKDILCGGVALKELFSN